MKNYLILLISFLIGIVCTGCSARTLEYQCMDTAMGTIFSQTLYVSDSHNAEAISDEILSMIDVLDKDILSRRLESAEVYCLNQKAGTGEKHTLSPLLGEVLEQCELVKEASGGAFDYTIGNLVELWDIDAKAVQASGFEPPSDDVIAEVIDRHQVDFRPDAGQILMPDGIRLDLGAVGKGVALDEVKQLLETYPQVTGAVISAGGSILTYGTKPDGSLWKVGIVDPFDTSQNVGILSLQGEWCISTSGDYERYVEADGIRYHHILDPATGRPADSGVKSVTILTKDGLMSDALSTACFVLGVEKGMELAELFSAEALFVDCNGTIFMTPGMELYF